MTEIIDVEAVEDGAGKALVNYVPQIRRTPAQVKADIEAVEDLMKAHMREGIDYGRIPGTPKDTLYKAGAERLARFFGLGAVVEAIRCVEDWELPFVLYVYRVGIGPITENGVVPIAWCEGSANSKERKFAKVAAYDVANTLAKMAQKRAYVGAVLMATNTSDFFTQDLEDLPRDFVQSNEATPAPKPVSKPKPQPVFVDGTDPASTVLNFGPHNGESLTQIATTDRPYLERLLESAHKKVEEGEVPSPEKLALLNAITSTLQGAPSE